MSVVTRRSVRSATKASPSLQSLSNSTSIARRFANSSESTPPRIYVARLVKGRVDSIGLLPIWSAVGRKALRSPADIRTSWALSSERIAAAAASVLSIGGGCSLARRFAKLAFAFSAALVIGIMSPLTKSPFNRLRELFFMVRSRRLQQ